MSSDITREMRCTSSDPIQYCLPSTCSRLTRFYNLNSTMRRWPSFLTRPVTSHSVLVLDHLSNCGTTALASGVMLDWANANRSVAFKSETMPCAMSRQLASSDVELSDKS